jgi:hypothetical protein
MASAMSDPTLEALWKNVVDNWDNDAAHATFLQHCQSTEQLAEAALRYAGMRGDRDRAASAKKRLEAVTVLATSSMLATRAEPLPVIPRWFTVLVLVFFSAMGGYVLLRALR